MELKETYYHHSSEAEAPTLYSREPISGKPVAIQIHHTGVPSWPRPSVVARVLQPDTRSSVLRSARKVIATSRVRDAFDSPRRYWARTVIRIPFNER